MIFEERNAMFGNGSIILITLVICVCLFNYLLGSRFRIWFLSPFITLISNVNVEPVRIGRIILHLNLINKADKLFVVKLANIDISVDINKQKVNKNENDIRSETKKDNSKVDDDYDKDKYKYNATGYLSKVIKSKLFNNFLSNIPGITIYFFNVNIHLKDEINHERVVLKIEKMRFCHFISSSIFDGISHVDEPSICESSFRHNFESNLFVDSLVIHSKDSKSLTISKYSIFSATYLVDTSKDLIPSNIILDVNNNGFNLRVLDMLRTILPLFNFRFKHKKESTKNLQKEKEMFNISDFLSTNKIIIQNYAIFLRRLNKINVNLSDIKIDQIYIWVLFLSNNPSKINEVLRMLKNSEDNSGNLGFMSKHYFTLNLAKYNVNINKLNIKSIGYDLMFSENDIPVQVISSLINLTFSLNDQFELFQIANINNNVQSNFLYQSLRLLNNLNYNPASIFKLSSHISSPTLDITTGQLSIIIQHFKQVTMFIKAITKDVKTTKYNKMPNKENNKQDQQDSDVFDITLKVLFKNISKVIPILLLKLTIEDGLFVLTHEDSKISSQSIVLNTNMIVFETTSQKKYIKNEDHNPASALPLNFNPSFSNERECNSPTTTDKVFQTSIYFRLDFSGIKIVYKHKENGIGVFNSNNCLTNSITNNRFSKEVMFLDFVSFKSSFQQLPILPSVAGNIILETLKIDFQNLIALKGLSLILESLNYQSSIDDSLHKIISQYFPEYYHTKIRKKSKINKLKKKVENDYRILFQYLPSWFTSIKFKGNNLSLSLPVRSLFIPKSELTNLKPLSDNEFINNNSRKLKFQVKSVSVELINELPFENSMDFSESSLSLNSVHLHPNGTNTEASRTVGNSKSSRNFIDEQKNSSTTFWNIKFQIIDVSMDIFSCDPKLFNSDDENNTKKSYSFVMSNMITIPAVNFSISSVQHNAVSKNNKGSSDGDGNNDKYNVFDNDLVFPSESDLRDATVFSVSSSSFFDSDTDSDSDSSSSSFHTISSNSIDVDFDIENISSKFSAFTFFIVLSSISLIRNSIFSFKNKPNTTKEDSHDQHDSEFHMQSFRSSSSSSTISGDEYPSDKAENNISCQLLSELIQVKINVTNLEVLFYMPLGLKTKFDFQENMLHLNSKKISLHSSTSRLFIQSPTLKHFFERLILLNDTKINLDITRLKRFLLLKKDQRFDNIDLNDDIFKVALINFKTFRISVPHGTIIHKIFDNISIFAKICKHLIRSFKSNTPDLILKIQHIVNAPILPKFTIAGERLLFILNDDPFESKFNSFYQIGLSEQKERLVKLELFVKKLKNDYSGIYDFEITNNNQLKIIILETNKQLFYCDGWVKDENNNGYSEKTEVFEIFNTFEVLQRNFSKSWISRIKIFKQKLAFEQQNNKEFFWMPDLVPTKRNAGKFIMSNFLLGNIPLLSCMFEDIFLTVSSVDFPIRELSEFLYSVGKQIPKDTIYQMMIPMNLHLRFKELRAHLRDYPIPLVYMPSTLGNDDIPISIRGNVVICEVYYDSEDNINRIFVPLVPSCVQNDNDKYYSLMVPKSVQSVKTFFKLNIENLNTEKSTRICWGVSYQTALQQIMKVFDGFTKPPLDPSEKVGFWDKLRANIHGRLNWRLNGLDIIFKGSRDPYKMIDIDSGYILSFVNDVNFDVNKADDTSKFFSVQAGGVRWVSPNFLREPLLVWSRKSSKSVYFANIENFSGFHNLSHFYLSQPEGNLQDDFNIVNERIESFYSKTVISLGTGVDFDFGISFERINDENKRTSNFIPHYKVRLVHPNSVKDDKNYDSYKCFRSQFINMQFHVDSHNKDKNNSLHFSPLEVKKVIQWWHLFSGNMSVPIKQGKIFGPATKSKKFSKYLSSIRYQFHLADIFISHTLRDDGHNYTEDIQKDRNESQFHGLGIKSKVGKLKVDLYQDKQSVVIHKQMLNLTQKIMKMKFNVGEINLENVDIRLIHAIFSTDQKNSDEEDILWYDYQDFDEYKSKTVKDMGVKFGVYPIVYSPHVVYFKKAKLKKSKSETEDIDTNNNRDDFEFDDQIESMNSNEVDDVNKSLYIDQSNIETQSSIFFQEIYEKDFTSSFIIHDMLLKWNCINRDLFFKYVHLVGITRSIIAFLKEDIIGSVMESLKNKPSNKSDDINSIHSYDASMSSKKCIGANDSTFCRAKLESFDEDLRFMDNSNLFYTEDYLIKLISPQIQFIEDTSSDACLILTSPDIEVKFISINQRRTDANSESGLLEYSDIVETRIGSLIHNANMFIFLQDDTKCKKYFSAVPYGVPHKDDASNSNWPPFFNKDFNNGESVSAKYMLLENTSMLIRYDKVGMLTNSEESESDSDETYESSISGVSKTSNDDHSKVKVNKITFFAPEIIVSSNSKQYAVLYSLLFNLLLYSEPSFKHLNNKLSKLALKSKSLHESSEEEDYKYIIVNKINDIRKRIALLLELDSNYNIARNEKASNNSKELEQYSQCVKVERDKLYSELYTTIKLVLLGGGTGKKKKKKKTTKDDSSNILEEINWFIRSDSIIFHMLLNEDEPFIDLAISNGQFERKEKGDQSTENFLSVQMMQGFALSADRYYQDILSPFDTSSLKDKKSSVNQSKHRPLLSFKWSLKPPVGGIKVIQYIDIDLKPMKIQLDENTGKQIINYLFKDTKISLNKCKKNPKEKKGSRLSKIFGSKKDDLDEEHDIDFDDISSDEDEDYNDIDYDSLVSKDEGEEGYNERDSISTSTVSKSSTKKSKNPVRGISEDVDANIMMERTNNNFSIESFKLHKLPLCVSYKGENGKQRLVSVDNFLLKLPNIVITKKILSMYDVTMFLKKVIFRLLLQHTGKLIGNKLKNRNLKKMNQDLPQLTEYNQFVSVKDLQKKKKETVVPVKEAKSFQG